ncbi:MAG: hypothetical protein QM726_00155 [Chitinophagaceae bacterium]
MKKYLVVPACMIALGFMACSGGGSKSNAKRVVIMASGKLTVTDKNIQIDPSLTHNEQEVTFTDDKVTLNVESTAGTKKTFDSTENGVYLLNLQTDTLIGGLVNYGDVGRAGSITAELLDHIIDSTQQLVQGANASDAKSTFFIVPFTLKKISAKNNTKVIGSFKGIPYKNEADADGNIPDVIKFSSVKDKRQTLQELLDKRSKLKKVG